MSQSDGKEKLPGLQMDAQELEVLRQRYVGLIGFVPRASRRAPTC